MLTGGELFAGIGGFGVAMRAAGIKPVYAVEIDERCQEVLRRNDPDLQVFGDVRSVGAANLPRVDIICGGFPCQPVSNAGKRMGRDDIRWLWPEFARVVRELRPRYVVVENVAALLTRGFDEVQADLAALGYDTEWDCLPASSFGAPHDRDRLFLVAYPSGPRRQQIARGPHGDEGSHEGRAAANDHVADGDDEGDRSRQVPGALAAESWPLADAKGQRRALRPAAPQLLGGSSGGGTTLADSDREGQLQQGGPVVEIGRWIGDGGPTVEDTDGGPVEPRRRRWRITEAGELLGWGPWAVEPGVGRMAHGVPNRLDRLTQLGNALVPQVATYILRRIVEAERAA